MVDDGTMLGELDHPDRLEVSLTNVSHVITNVELIDNGLFADIRILETPKGNILKSIIEANIDVGFEARYVNGVFATIDAINVDNIKLRRRKLEKIMKNIRNATNKTE